MDVAHGVDLRWRCIGESALNRKQSRLSVGPGIWICSPERRTLEMSSELLGLMEGEDGRRRWQPFWFCEKLGRELDLFDRLEMDILLVQFVLWVDAEEML